MAGKSPFLGVRESDYERFSGELGKPDQRSPFQLDRDRVLYSSAFHRLNGITQVVSSLEGSFFHNRYIHSIKVAQVGRRLAEHLKFQHNISDSVLLPDVVECACLVHDIGHPPFGHLGEKTLNSLVNNARQRTFRDGKSDSFDGISKTQETKHSGEGYEGNAQSFRIAVALDPYRAQEYQGLDLTRRSLNALLKYPWLHDENSKERSKKWGCYSEDREIFEWVQSANQTPGRRTLEASIMDIADDFSYATHDIEDFTRAGFIPWGNLFQELSGITDQDRPRLSDRLFHETASAWEKEAAITGTVAQSQIKQLTTDAIERIILNIIPEQWTYESFRGSGEEISKLRRFVSELLGTFIKNSEISPADLLLGPNAEVLLDNETMAMLKVLKAITSTFVFNHHSLTAQQRGQKKIIESLFDIFTELIKDETTHLHLAPRLQSVVKFGTEYDTPSHRIAADCVSSLTEPEAVQMYQRFNGFDAAAVIEPVVT